MDKILPVTDSITYRQPADCCQTGKDDQILEVKVQDGGGGPFIVLKTERWSFDAESLEAFTKQVKELLEECEARELKWHEK